MLLNNIIISIFLLISLQDMRRIDLHMSKLIEGAHLCLESSENFSMEEFKQMRQNCLDYYIENIDVFPVNRIYYWENEIETLNRKFIKLKKRFKDD